MRLSKLKRHDSKAALGKVDVIHGDLARPEDIKRLNLRGIDTVVHAGATVSSRDRKKRQSEFKIINVKATKQLATRARECGVKRFIFLSSIRAAFLDTFENRPKR